MRFHIVPISLPKRSAALRGARGQRTAPCSLRRISPWRHPQNRVDHTGSLRAAPERLSRRESQRRHHAVAVAAEMRGLLCGRGSRNRRFGMGTCSISSSTSPSVRAALPMMRTATQMDRPCGPSSSWSTMSMLRWSGTGSLSCYIRTLPWPGRDAPRLRGSPTFVLVGAVSRSRVSRLFPQANPARAGAASTVVVIGDFREYENGVADVLSSWAPARSSNATSMSLADGEEGGKRQVDVLVRGDVFGLGDATLVVECRMRKRPLSAPDIDGFLSSSTTRRGPWSPRKPAWLHRARAESARRSSVEPAPRLLALDELARSENAGEGHERSRSGRPKPMQSTPLLHYARPGCACVPRPKSAARQ